MTSAEMRVAIVGGATLKGRELADLLKERNFATDLRLLDDEESLGQLEAVGDEVTFIQSVARDQFEQVDVAFFASDEKYTRANWRMARDAGCAIVDLSYGLETEPGAVVLAPWVERELGIPARLELQPAPLVPAHPAAVVLALLLARARKAGAVRHAVATVIEPASERGRRGMDELHEQTVNLLSFKELPKQVFDQQVAFNMLARYGEASEAALESIQDRIVRHIARITGGQIEPPSLMLLQGPSFHSHAFAIHVEMDSAVELNEFAKALVGEHVEVTFAPEDSPSNVSAAGQNDILVTVRPDAQQPNSVWMWASADNLRVLVMNAADCAGYIAAAKPQGRIQ
jgi:aspartate-semialdehyde dehydrogenase